MSSEKYLTSELRPIRDRLNDLFKANNLPLTYDDAEDANIMYLLNSSSVEGLVVLNGKSHPIFTITIIVTNTIFDDILFTKVASKVKSYAKKGNYIFKENNTLGTLEVPFETKPNFSISKVVLNEVSLVNFINEILNLITNGN